MSLPPSPRDSPHPLARSPRAAQNTFKKNTGPYKVPREIEFVDTLPKTVSGKIRRVELRDLEKERKKDVLKQIKSKL